jgi:hypothetical protein
MSPWDDGLWMNRDGVRVYFKGYHWAGKNARKKKKPSFPGTQNKKHW